MTFYYRDSWLGYIADRKQSAILHPHYQLSLLKKLKLYLERIRGEMLSDIAVFYSTFESKLRHSNDSGAKTAAARLGHTVESW